MKSGVGTDYSEEEATKILSEDYVTVVADIKMGDATATAWGCDLTYDYVKINADYRSQILAGNNVIQTDLMITEML